MEIRLVVHNKLMKPLYSRVRKHQSTGRILDILVLFFSFQRISRSCEKFSRPFPERLCFGGQGIVRNGAVCDIVSGGTDRKSL